jgi:UDP-glucose:(heptosyl)LPS alpha-1,3-glucosyltransferase
MNLALVIEDLDPARGGAEVFSARLGRWLLQAGHGVTVLAARWDPALERDYRACSARARFERIPRCIGPRALGTYAFARGAASRIAALKRAGAVDLSLDMGWGILCDVVLTGDYRANRQGSLAALDHPHERAWARATGFLSPLERLRRRLQALRFGRQPPPHVMALSRRMAHSLGAQFHLPPDHLHVIPHGAEVERFAPERLSPWRAPTREALGVAEEVLVLTVAHNYRLKGVASILGLAERAERRGDPFRFVVVGGGRRLREQYRLEALRRRAAVRFIAPTPAVERYYAAADVFLLPTFYDACSLVVFEALAAGLPVITTRRNGASEALEPGRTGFVLEDPRDLEAMEERLRELRDPGRRAQMGTAARESAGRYTMEANYAAVAALLTRLSGELPAGAPAPRRAPAAPALPRHR